MVILAVSHGCKKKTEEAPATGPVPVVTTVNYSNVLLNTAEFSGNVTDDRGLYVSRHGFCWSRTNLNPTIQNDTMVAGDGAGAYAGIIKGLNAQSKYYVRAFAGLGDRDRIKSVFFSLLVVWRTLKFRNNNI